VSSFQETVKSDVDPEIIRQAYFSSRGLTGVCTRPPRPKPRRPNTAPSIRRTGNKLQGRMEEIRTATRDFRLPG